MAEDLLPDSRLKESKGEKRLPFANVMPLNWAPIFCANCGAPGGYVPEENCTFAFYLCNPCAEKWSPLAGTMAVPDEIFWAKVREAQIEKYGRELTEEEIHLAMMDESSIFAKLAREAPRNG
jgi:hypothetical protein